MVWKCFRCEKPLRKINFHWVRCGKFKHRKHRFCGGCVPSLMEAKILKFTSEPKFAGMSMTDDYKRACPTKELETAARLKA